MKKNIKIIISLVVVCGLMCAFTIVPHLHLEGENSYIDVLYMNASAEDDILTIDINYDAENDIPFEILKDITVKTGNNQSKELRLINTTEKDGKYISKFDFKNQVAEKVYIEPPILYTPKNISTISQKVETGNIVKTNDGKEWFTISDVELIEKSEEDTAVVKVTFLPKNDCLPSLPELKIDEKYYGGVTVTHFDETGNFTLGECFFYVPMDGLNASEGKHTLSSDNPFIVIDRIMERMEVSNIKFTSNIKTLTVQRK